MGLEAIVASGIATAKAVVGDLLVSVTHEAWTGQSSQGNPTYASGVAYDALVEEKTGVIRDVDGRESIYHTKVTILEPVTANGSSGRKEPVDPNDRFTMPNGKVGRVKAVGSDGAGEAVPLAKTTSAPFMLEVWLGD